MKIAIRSLVASVLALFAASSQLAAAPADEVVSRDAIEAALQRPKETAEPEVRTRGLTRGIKVTERSSESRGAIDLQVAFDLGSATLMPEARTQLKELAGALQSPRLVEQSFVLAGHTDSSGRAGYNRALSEARAASVRSYLAAEGVDAKRLSVAGYGSDRPLAGKDPQDPANRRVEVRTLETTP